MTGKFLDCIHHGNSKISSLLCTMLDWVESRLIYNNIGFKGAYPLGNIGMNLFFYRMG